jgi:hypothetical protein
MAAQARPFGGFCRPASQIGRQSELTRPRDRSHLADPHCHR